MNVNIGHGHQRITRAVMEQMQKVSYVTPSCSTEVRGELGKKLASVVPPGMSKALFTVCGATAIENAMKLLVYTPVVIRLLRGTGHFMAHPMVP